MAREFVDRQRSKWGYIRRTDRKNTGLVIFVHGFRGSYLGTWGQLADFLTHEADKDPTLAKWDYLFIGYETYSIDTYLNIAKLIGSQWKEASTGSSPFSKNRYTKLALFAHSLGTLGVRQLLCAISEQRAGLANALKKAVLFGSPLNGSPLASMAGLAAIADAFTGRLGAMLPGKYRIASALEPGNAQLEMLWVWSNTVRDHGGGRFGPTKLILGTDDAVVGTGPLVDWSDDEKIITALSHSEMVKVKVNKSDGSPEGCVLDELLKLGRP